MMEFRENCLSCEDYRRLRQSVGWNNFSAEQAQRALGRSLYSVTAYENGLAVGMGRLIGDGIYDVVVDVAVMPRYQRQGIGSAILQMLLDFAQSAAPEGGRVSVQLIAEKGKEPFYEEMGFKRLPHAFCGSGMRRVIHKEGRSI